MSNVKRFLECIKNYSSYMVFLISVFVFKTLFLLLNLINVTSRFESTISSLIGY